MPDTPVNNNNRNLDFLDTGYANLKRIDYNAPAPKSTGAFPVSPNPMVPIDPKAALDSIFANLTYRDKNIGINQPIRTPLAQTARYASSIYGYDPLNPNLENQYGDRQGFFNTLGNYTGKFLANTVGAFVESVATIPLVVNALREGDASKIYDNGLTNGIADWLENLETSLPTYQTTAQKNNPVLSWLPLASGSLHNWGSLLQNLGYTAGSIAGSLAQDAFIGAATGGVGELPLIAPQIMKAFGKFGKYFTAEKGMATTLTQSLSRTDNIFDAINTSANQLKLLDKFRYGLAIGTSAFAEGAFEANQTYRNIEETLRNEYIKTYGYEPKGSDLERIEEYSRGGGNADLFGNVALLSLTNSAVFGSLFKPFTEAQKSIKTAILGSDDVALKQGTIDIFEKAVKPKTKFSIIANSVANVTRPVRTSAIEGFEEGSQFFMQRSAEDYYKRKFNDDSISEVDNFMKSLGTGLKDTLTTREGLENVFMGILSGSVIHASRGAIERYKGLNNNKNNLIDSTITILNSQRLSGLFRNTYDEAVTADSIVKDMQKSLENGDIFEYQNLKFQQLFNFVESGVRANRYDLRIDQLNMLKDLKPEQFEQMFGIEFSQTNKKTINEFVDNVINKAEAIKNNIDKIERVFPNPYKQGTNNYLVFNEYKSMLAMDLSEAEDNNRRFKNINSEVLKINSSVNIQELMNLTNDKGITEIVSDFRNRVDQLSDSIEAHVRNKEQGLYKEQEDPKHIKEAIAERAFLQEKIVDLKDAIENYDEAEFKKHALDIINYWANNKSIVTNNRIYPIDIHDLLKKGQDAFRLVSNADRALYHYQQLTEKKGFNEFFANLVEEYNKQDQKFNDNNPLNPDNNIPNAEQPPIVEGVEDIDPDGNPIVPTKPTSPTTSSNIPPVRPSTDITPKENKNSTTVEYNGKTYNVKEGEIKEVENGKEFKADLTTETAKEITELANKKNIPEGFVDSSTPVAPLEFEKEPSVKEGVQKALDEKKDVPTNSIKMVADPSVLFNRLFTKDFKDGNLEKQNLKETMFSKDPVAFYNTLSIKMTESTQGLQKGDYRKFPEFDNIYYTGYGVDITVYSGNKAIGKIQPAGRLSFKKQGQYIPLSDITLEDYEKVTGNHPSTFNDFISQIAEYKLLDDKLASDFKNGKREYTNDEFKNMIDIVVKYGGIQYPKSDAGATKLKDLKYRGKGSAILSFPMFFNKDLNLFQRSTRPEILNKNQLSEQEIQDVLDFVMNNINNITKLDRRYIYLMKMPDGKFHNFSAIAARPGKATNKDLESIFSILKTRYVELDQQKVKRINNTLKETIYVADSRNRKDLKSNLRFSVGVDSKENTAHLYLDIHNKVYNINKRINITEAREAKTFDEMIDIINQKLTRVSIQLPELSKLNIKIEKQDFSKGILNDSEVKLSDIEENLTIAATSDVFDKFSVLIFPKDLVKKEQPAPKPAPKEPIVARPNLNEVTPEKEEIFNTIVENLGEIKGEYRTGIEVMKDDPAMKETIVDAIISQTVNDPEAAKTTFGKTISEKVVKLIPEAAKNEAENIKTFQVAKDVKGLATIFKSLFGLKPKQANTVADIYDRTAEAWAKRNNSTKEEFYKKLTFQKVNEEDLDTESVLFAGKEFEQEKAAIKKSSTKNGTFMKAPNGKPTNLTEDQWLTTKTERFKKWFGDSKILDSNGEPIVMYHGTRNEFSVFDTKYPKSLGLIFTTPEYEFAEDYTNTRFKEGTVFELFVKASNPFDYENANHLNLLKKDAPFLYSSLTNTPSEDNNWAILETSFFQSFLKDNNFDGFYLKEQGIKNVAVYKANQVKDASGKNETFLTENPDVFFQGSLSNSAMLANVIKGFDLQPAKGFGRAYQTKTGTATPNLANKINKWLSDNGYNNIKFVYESTYKTVNPFIKQENLLFQSSKDDRNLAIIKSRILKYFEKRGIPKIILNKLLNGNKKAVSTLVNSEAYFKLNGFDKTAFNLFLNGDYSSFKNLINVLDEYITEEHYTHYVYLQFLKELGFTRTMYFDLELNRLNKNKQYNTEFVNLNEIYADLLKDYNMTFLRDENGHIEPMISLDESIDESVGKKAKKRLKKQLKKGLDSSFFDVSKQFAFYVVVRNEFNHPELLNQQAKGAIRLADDGSAIIYALTNPDVSTPLHELAHFWERQLTELEKEEVLEWAGTGEEWSVETSEKFARGFELYLAEGKAPSEGLQKIFDNFKKWLRDVYKALVGNPYFADVQLNDSMRNIYATMIGENFEQELKEEVKQEQQLTKKRFNYDKLKEASLEQLQEKLEEAQIDISHGLDKNDPELKDREQALKNEIQERQSVEKEQEILAPTEQEGFIEEEQPFEPDMFTQEDVGSKVMYKDKELIVEEVTVTPSGNIFLTITDGSKYGQLTITPDKVKKIHPITNEAVESADSVNLKVIDEGLLKDIHLRDYKEEYGFDKDGDFTDNQEDIDNLTINYVGLKIVLENLKSRFNIPYTVVASDEDWKGRFENGVVVININKVGRDTPFHEYLHPFIAVLKVDNPNLYRNLVYEASTNRIFLTELKALSKNDYYKNKTKEEIGDEALVRFISTLAAKNIDSTGRKVKSFYQKVTNELDRLLQKFRTWLTNVIQGIRYAPNEAKDKDQRSPLHKTGYVRDLSREGIVTARDLPETMTMQDMADFISFTGISVDMSNRLDLINKLNEFQADTVKTEEGKIIDRIKRRLDVLEDTAKRRTPSDLLLSEMVAIRAILKNTDEIESINSYVQRGLEGLDFANDEFKRLSTKLKEEKKFTQKDIQELSKSLSLVKNLLAFYDDVSLLFGRIVEELDDKEYRYYSKILNQANNNAKYIKSRSVEIVTEWLYPYIEDFNEKIKEKYPDYVLTKEQFKNKLYTADEDSDFLFHWLGSVSSSSDPVSAITRTALFDIMEENHLFEAELGETIKITYAEFLKKTGIKNEIKQTEDYYRQNYLRKATVLQRTDKKDENDKYIYEYTQKWAFHEEFYFDLYMKEKDDFLEQLGERPEEGTKEYQQYVDKIFAWEDVNGSFSKPAERFRNPEFTKLYRHDEFFTQLYETYKIGNEKLGEDERLKYGIVPQVSKGQQAFQDIKNSEGIVSKAKTIRGKIVDFIIPKVEDETTFSDNQENLDGSIYKKIVVPYTRSLDENDLSLVLPENVFKFAGAANLTSLKREVEPNVTILKSLLEGNSKFVKEARKINKVTSDRKTIFDHIFKLPARKEERIAKLNKQLIAWIDDVMFGVDEQQDSVKLLGRSIDLNKLGGNLAFLTALNNMAFNVTAGVGNVTIGNIMSFGESLGGKYYQASDWRKASAQYFSNTNSFLKDAFDLKKSKITQLGIKYDAIQGEFRDKYGKKFVGNVAQRYATSDTIFFLNHAAEHQIQLVGMLALMNATKVRTTNGEEISLYDAHIVNEKGYLRLRNDIIWTKSQEQDFTRRLHGLNKMLNGNYSKFDKAHLQRTWYGKLLLIYRKFMYTSFRARYGRKRMDYEIGDQMEGYYRKFFNKLGSDIKAYKWGMISNMYRREGWTEEEKYAANKTLWELGLFMGTLLVTLALASGDEDDKDEKAWIQNYLSLQMLRLRSDIGMYSVFGVTDVMKVVQNPSAVILTLKRYGDVLTQIVKNPFETYDRRTGTFDKGDSILQAKILKALPIVRQFINLLQPEEQAKFYRLLNKY